ncbi:MAG: hypothetical protein HFI05_04500 [Lachnospiraceae bacterium]|jgi:hypothetical protein|nr:hypothetical protein [Lachnospiraceae bacterium]
MMEVDGEKTIFSIDMRLILAIVDIVAPCEITELGLEIMKQNILKKCGEIGRKEKATKRLIYSKTLNIDILSIF